MIPRAGPILLMLLATLTTHAIFGSGQAMGADCSSPPSGFGGSWFRAYQNWCRQCGGTPSATANPPRCTPGPNWGGRGSGGSGGGAVDAFATGVQRMLEDYARKTEEEKKQMMGIMDRESRERALFEAEQARAAAERARREEERLRSGALKGLKGLPGSEIGIRSPGDAERVEIKRPTALFGIAGNPHGALAEGDLPQKQVPPAPDSAEVRLGGSTPLLLRESEPRGHRIVDCDRAKETRKRLAAGLPVQREAIERTRAQIEAARADIRGASAKTREILLKAAKEESLSLAKEAVTSAKALRLRVAALKGEGVPIEKRRQWLETLDAVSESAGAMGKLEGAGKAGYAAGVEFRESSRKLSEDVGRLNKLFVESGIAEQIGETLAESAGGPLGALAFRAAKLSIDVGVAQAGAAITEEEYRRALENLEAMRTQHHRAEDGIKDLDADIAQYCRTGNAGAPSAPSTTAGR